MKLFAGVFTLETPTGISGDVLPQDFDYDLVKLNDTSYYIIGGEENINSSLELFRLLETTFWKISEANLSLEGEDLIEILAEEFPEDAVYESACFEWTQVDFAEICKRFAESSEVVCVRQGKESFAFETRKVYVDFLY